MDDARFQEVDRMLERGEFEGSLGYLIQQFLAEKNYPLLMEARLMKARLDLGLPLIQSEAATTFPRDKQPLYETAVIDAARETGELFLADGSIERAWPYFRAIGEPRPVAEAIERVQPGEGIEPIIEIAFQQGVHPVKGLELILAQYGMCRAITSFGMYAVEQGREDCIRLLARSLHAELVDRLQAVIERNEGARPGTDNVITLISERDWLFGEYDYYVDTSHLVSVIQYGADSTDASTLSLVRELCEYGARLSANFQSRGEPPFENIFQDYGIHTRVLLGQDVEHGIAHFRAKVATASEYAGTIPAQILVGLLARIGRYADALDISLEHLREVSRSELMCPSPLQLCHMSGDYERLKTLARESGDVLSYAAATMTQPATKSGSRA